MTDSLQDFASRPPRHYDAPGHMTGANRNQILDTLELIIRAYHAGALGGTVHEVYPGIDRSSLPWRLYFTLPCAINYQRKSENLWKSALETFNDPSTRFVFDCANVTLGHQVYKAALAKHGLALQRDKHTHIWFTISTTLYELFDGDPLKLLGVQDFDVVKIKAYVSAHKRLFPYMSGPKLLNYWLYIFSFFTDVKLTRREDISVIPDTHVKRATVALGLINEEASQDTEAVALLWYSFLKGTPYTPCDLHAPLWRWSRAGMPSREELLALAV